MKLIENIGKEQLQFGDSEFIRENFLIEDLIAADEILMYYTPYDRIIIGGVNPQNEDLTLGTYHALLKSSYFCERRELGIINIGDEGTVHVDGISYGMEQYSCLYLLKVTKEVVFKKS